MDAAGGPNKIDLYLISQARANGGSVENFENSIGIQAILYGGCERGFFFCLWKNLSRAESRMTFSGQMIECSVLRYGIFSHGKLAPT